MRISCGRCGVSTGIDCAAASVTTPRIPAHPSTMPPRQPSASSRRSSRSFCRRSMVFSNRWMRFSGCLAKFSLPRICASALLELRTSAFEPLGARLLAEQQRPDEREPDDEHDADHEQPVEHGLLRAEVVLLDLADQVADLQAHEQEDAVLQHELERAPVDALGDPGLRAEALRARVPGVETGDDDGEHAARAEVLGGQERDERHRERDRGVEHRVAQLRAHEHGDEAHDEPDRDGDRHREDEVARRPPRRSRWRRSRRSPSAASPARSRR